MITEHRQIDDSSGKLTEFRSAVRNPLLDGVAPNGTATPKASIAAMHRRQGGTQTILVFGNQNSMNVVWHQAISPTRNPRRFATGGQKIPEGDVVCIIKKNLLPPIAALRDVMRKTGDDEAGDTGHGDWGN